METAKASWFVRAEEAIRSLRDVESASIQCDGDSIREIHVLTRSNRSPKQIVRDVQTVLLTRINRSIDYRVVSVAYLGTQEGGGAVRVNGPTRTAPEPRAIVEDAMPVESSRADTPQAARPVEASSPVGEPRTAPPSTAPATREPVEVATAQRATPGATRRREIEDPARERIRFGSVNLFVSGARTQAQVELRWHGLPRMGSASGWSTRSGAHRLVALATVAAVQEFLAEELALGLLDVEFLGLGRKRAVVVSLSLLVDRQEKLLVGSCVVEQDLQQAVVCATLAALNRLVGAMPRKEPTEYVLRPTSAQ